MAVRILRWRLAFKLSCWRGQLTPNGIQVRSVGAAPFFATTLLVPRDLRPLPQSTEQAAFAALCALCLLGHTVPVLQFCGVVCVMSFAASTFFPVW